MGTHNATKPLPNRKIIRLQNYDYSQNGFYFVTICTKNRQHYFGKIRNSIMCLSTMGQIAYRCWQKIPHYHPQIELDAFIVMPDHIHGIININKKSTAVNNTIGNRFGPQSENLGSIIRGFKIGVKKYATTNNIPFAWHKRYHDHIIKNPKSLKNIRRYIQKNPTNWPHS